MSRICQTAEYAIDNRETTENIRALTTDTSKPLCDSLVLSAVIASSEEKAKLLVVVTETGISARLGNLICILKLINNLKLPNIVQVLLFFV